MEFSLTRQSIDSPHLAFDYFLVPWDSEILGFPVAGIDRVRVGEPHPAGKAFAEYERWVSDNGVRFCSCRLAQDHLDDLSFLQSRGFQFVELNYRPELSDLENFRFPEPTTIESDIQFVPADAGDADELADMALRTFSHGRFHQDPKLGPGCGNKRYSIWMKNAFKLEHQSVMKALLADRIIGFFVVEKTGRHVHWSLVGLSPGNEGQGLGVQTWRALLRHHLEEGVQSVSTSISSHNVPVFNLYVKLGFRFPMPVVTLHWHLS